MSTSAVHTLMPSKTDLLLLPFPQPFQNNLITYNLTKCIFMGWKPLWGIDKRTTIERLTPKRAWQQQLQNQPLNGATYYLIWGQPRASPWASSCLEVKWLPEGCVFTHSLKLKNEVRLFLNILFGWLVGQWWLLDYMADVNMYLLKVFNLE